RGRGHLIEQRLEKMMVLPVEHYGRKTGAAQRLRHFETGKASPHNDDARGARLCRYRSFLIHTRFPQGEILAQTGRPDASGAGVSSPPFRAMQRRERETVPWATLHRKSVVEGKRFKTGGRQYGNQ